MSGFFVTALFLCGCISSSHSASRPLALESANALSLEAETKPVDANLNVEEVDFEGFQERFGKRYTEEEIEHRRMVFEANKKKVETNNADKSKQYTLEVNKFADLTHEEFKKLYTGASGGQQSCSATGTHVRAQNGLSVPESMDWRDKGVVSPVKDQGQCGSCWTFSTTGALESAHALVYGEIVSLSEQQLVDCAGNFDTAGCDGGLPSHAFEYVRYNGGIDTELAYPYKGKDGSCHYESKAVATKVKGSVNITQNDEAELQDAVGLHKPVSIAFDCADDFMLYKSGVYSSDTCGSTSADVNHAVLVVGYGSQDGEDYWIVKNSWGASWGEAGFFRIKRNVNMCGLATCASYPELEI